MSVLFLHCEFNHFDNGIIHTLSYNADELFAVKQGFIHAVGTELSDENYDAATDKIKAANSIEELKNLEINYNSRFYRRVIKLCSIKPITEQEYNSLIKANENTEGWAY